MSKKTIHKETFHTDLAPAAIGTYSQAVRHGDLVFISGQIPLDPTTMEIVDGDIRAHIVQVFENLSNICKAAGGSLNACVKLTVFLTDFTNFSLVNEVMATFVDEPYPARAAIGVAELPKGVGVEIEAVMGLSD